jgi:hypothetical protein
MGHKGDDLMHMSEEAFNASRMERAIMGTSGEERGWVIEGSCGVDEGWVVQSKL